MKSQIPDINYFKWIFFGKEFRDHLEDEGSEGVHSYIKFQ